MGGALRIALAWLLAACLSASADCSPSSVLIDWAVQQGGVVQGEIRERPDSLRGLFATKDIAAGEDIVSIPEAIIINGGSVSRGIMSPILAYLRELHTPCTRFRRYLDVLPTGEDVWNFCTMPREHVKLLKAPHWERYVDGYQNDLREAHSGEIRERMELTFEDVLGDKQVSLEEVQRACAVVVSRLYENKRGHAVLVPVMDMANHWHNCPNYLADGDKGAMKLMAGQPLKKGDEVCYGYGTMRDDHALFHYGFLPPEESPLRLLLLDHHDFDPSNDSFVPTEEPFQGTMKAMQAEVARLQAILTSLGEAPPVVPASQKNQSGLDLVLQLWDRRVRSLKAEVARLLGVLERQGAARQEL